MKSLILALLLATTSFVSQAEVRLFNKDAPGGSFLKLRTVERNEHFGTEIEVKECFGGGECEVATYISPSDIDYYANKRLIPLLAEGGRYSLIGATAGLIFYDHLKTKGYSQLTKKHAALSIAAFALTTFGLGEVIAELRRKDDEQYLLSETYRKIQLIVHDVMRGKEKTEYVSAAVFNEIKK